MWIRLTNILISFIFLHTVMLPSVCMGSPAKGDRAEAQDQTDQPKKKKKKKKSVGTHLMWLMAEPTQWRSLARASLSVKAFIESQEKDVHWAIPYLEPPIPEEGADQIASEYKKIKKWYKKGKKWLRKERFSRAVKQFEKARKSLEKLVADWGYIYNLRKRLVYVYLYTGAALMGDSKTEEARASFRRACALWPSFPAPKSFTDALADFYHESCKLELTGTGTLVANSSLPGFVFIDGNLMGVSPGRIEKIPPGYHVVTWGRMGYDMMIKEIRVSEGGTAVADFRARKSHFHDELMGAAKQMNSLLKKKKSPALPVLADIMKRMRVTSRALIVRGDIHFTEFSYFDLESGWIKRVRRKHKVPGRIPLKRIKMLFAKQTPRFDMRAPIQRRIARCFSDSDCPADRECQAGRCVVAKPFYKKWWFWTAVGVGVSVVGGGGYVIYELSTRPSIELTSP